MLNAMKPRMIARTLFSPIGAAALAASGIVGCGGEPDDATSGRAQAPVTVEQAGAVRIARGDKPAEPAPLGELPDPFRFDDEVAPTNFGSSTRGEPPLPLPELPDFSAPAEVVEGFKGEVGLAADEVVDGVKDRVSGIKGDAARAADDMRGGVDQAIGEARDGVRATIDEVKGGALGTADELRSGVDQTIEEVKGGVRQMTDEAKDGVRGAVDGFKGQVAGEAQRAKDGLKQSAQELKGQLLDDLFGPSDLPPPEGQPEIPPPPPLDIPPPPGP